MLSANLPKYSKSHIARSRSSSPAEVAQDQLSTSSHTRSPPRVSESHLERRSQSVSDKESTTSSPASSLPDSHLSEKGSTASSGGVAYANYLPAGFEVLPACCYNYQPYIPPSPPAVLPWPRKQLYHQIVNSCPPVFLSCNLTNPVHLADIIAYRCVWSCIEEIAKNMTPALNYEFVETENLGAWKRVDGVLVGGLLPEAREKLEARMKRIYGERYERRVEEVMVEVKDGEDGEVVDVAAYVYREA